MTDIDRTTIVIEGHFKDASVSLPALTKLEAGTVLGAHAADTKLAQFKSDATTGEQNPSHVLMQDLDNSAGESGKVYTNVRVLEQGMVNSAKLKFSGAETLATIIANKGSVEHQLKNAGILVRTSQSVVS